MRIGVLLIRVVIVIHVRVVAGRIKEMQRKVKDYFFSGVRLVWFVDPMKRTIEVFTAPDQATLLTEEQSLDGGEVLPGLTLEVREVFRRVPRRPSKRASTNRKGRNKS